MKPSVEKHLLSWARRLLRWCCLVLLPSMVVAPAAWAGCTLSGGASSHLGSFSSLEAVQPIEVLFDSGFSCDPLDSVAQRNQAFAILSVGVDMDSYPISYVAHRLANTNDPSQVIDFEILDATTNEVFSFGSTKTFDLRDPRYSSGISDSVPLKVVTRATSQWLKAGTYSGRIVLTWVYFYAIDESFESHAHTWQTNLGKVVTYLAPFTQRGTEVIVTLNLTLERDCRINAPDLSFDSAPLAAAFNPVTRTITIRCSKSETYDVGLSDGANFDGTTRRMRSPAGDYLSYELLKGSSGKDRWGHTGSERRESTSFDRGVSVQVTNGSQSYIYRGVIEPNQPTPPAGTYRDSVVVDVSF